MRKRLRILGLKRLLELQKKFVQIVTENEKFVSRYKQLFEPCKLLVLVMCVNEFEKYIRKVEKLWRIDD